MTPAASPVIPKFWRGVAAGAGATYAIGCALGYFPLFFGPETRAWSNSKWNSSANELMDKLFSEGYSLYKPQGSIRNFLSVASSTPERRVRKVFFFNRSTMTLMGIVHFGADTEGPPACVHGGCTAAVLDAAAGIAAYRANLMPCVTASLTVNYKHKIPLGSTLLIEITLAKPIEGRKTHLAITLTDLKRKSTYATGEALMVNAVAVSNFGEVPAFLKASKA